MNENALNDCIIRTAVARRKGLGFIYATDPHLEEAGIPHAVIFKWKDGKFEAGKSSHNAHSACVISKPEPGIVDISDSGYYGVNSKSTKFVDEIFDKSLPEPKRHGYVGFNNVCEIDGRAYAVGLNGMVYRLDDLKIWMRIDFGLPELFNVHMVDGFSETEIYAVGGKGALWHYNGIAWVEYPLATNTNLYAVICADDGYVYIVGKSGALFKGRRDRWEDLSTDSIGADFNDIDWFKSKLYVASFQGVFSLVGNELVPVDFGVGSNRPCHLLSVGEEVLWAIGEKEIFEFDGGEWDKVL